MAAAELVENPKTPNVNFIGIQKQIADIIKDIKNHKKKPQTAQICQQQS